MFLKIIVKLVEVSNSSFKLLYGLRRKDIELLEHIKTYFGVGKIHKHGSESVVLRVYSTKDMQVIISHLCARQKVSFNNKKKIADYALFKLAYYIIINKEHYLLRTTGGSIQISSYKRLT